MKTSLLIHPQELGDAWIRRAKAAGADILALHPVGGKHAAESLEDLLRRLETEEFRALVDRARHAGLEIEYELHAASWMLDRGLFPTHPEYFRMNEAGERTPDANLCPSDEGAMALVADRAAELSAKLYRSSHRFYFWLDDCRARRCFCPRCRSLSASDQQTLFVNRVAQGVRRVFPDATVAYLAYFDCIEPPETVAPAPGVFLEYAPFEEAMGRRDHRPPKVDEAAQLPGLFKRFGRAGARVLGYWLDNSLYSDWSGTPARFCADTDAFLRDAERYREMGFSELATFACYLGDDYAGRYGEPELTGFFLPAKQ